MRDSGLGSSAQWDAADRVLFSWLDLPIERIEERLGAMARQDPAMAEALQSRLGQLRRLGFVSATSTANEPVAGRTFGGYEIERLLGTGGMGSVYLATQKSPRRQVALKVIRPDRLGDPAARDRFQREARAVAALRDPGICTVLEVGEVEGTPFLAMQYIEGQTVAEQLAAQRAVMTTSGPSTAADIGGVLQLIEKVARSLHVAHEAGVVHRDVKPGNLMIDRTGEPVLLDFGLARVEKAGDEKSLTRTGDVVGTPAYMSPEQLRPARGGVDRRTDVYSLAATLFECLTLMRPFAGASELELYERILGDPTPDPRRHNPHLPVDVGAVIGKAMEKEPARRYATAAEFAEDLARIGRGEPVRARHIGRLGRLWRWSKRYPAVASLIVVLVTGVVVVALFLGITLRQRDDLATTAEKLSNLASAEAKAKEEAQQSANVAEQRAKELEQVLTFQESQWSEVDSQSMGVHLRGSMLAATKEARRADVEAGLAGVNFTDLALGMLQANLFDRSLAAIGKGFAEQPLVKARLLQSVAHTLRELGLLDRATVPQTEALEIRRRILGDDHPSTLYSTNNMGWLLLKQGKLAEAEPLTGEALAGRRRILGDDHPDTVNSINNMGTLLRERGKLAEAEPLLREALEKMRRILGDDHPHTLSCIGNMGTLFHDQGRLAEAELLHRESLEKSRRILGEDHPSTLTSINNLGGLLHAQGKLTEAESLYREALEKSRRILGEGHPSTLSIASNLGFELIALGRTDEGELLCRETLETSRRILGDEHPNTLSSLKNMCRLLQEQRKFAEAEPLYRELLEKMRRILGDVHPDTLTSINNMSMMLQDQGKLGEAEPLLREALEGLRRNLGDDHPRTLGSINNLGMLLQDQGKLAEAEPLFREVMERRRRILGDDDPRTLMSINKMGALLLAQNKLAEAEPLFREAMETGRRVLGDDHLDTLIAIHGLGRVLVRTGRHGEAVALLSAAEIPARRVFTGGRAAWLADFLATVGRALGEAAQDFAAAEAKLLEAHTISTRLLGPRHKQTRACAQALIHLYEAWHAAEPQGGHDQQATEWKAKLDQLAPERGKEAPK